MRNERDKVPSLFVTARRSTSALDPVDALPSFWTFPIGVIAGLFVVGRIARWLLGVISVWKGSGPADTTEPKRREWFALFLVAVANPTPWLVLISLYWVIRRLIVAPVLPSWWWFIAGFVVGPPITLAWVLHKARKLRSQRAQGGGTPAP
jgi:hypothetical protein